MRHKYSRSISREGCIRQLASSPSVVNNNRPAVLISKRPTAIQRKPLSLGNRSNTVGRPSGSEVVVTSPSGLLYASTRGPSWVMILTTNSRSSILMVWPSPKESPIAAGRPSTWISPRKMRSSISRREPMPALDSSFCRRSGPVWSATLRLSDRVGRRLIIAGSPWTVLRVRRRPLAALWKRQRHHAREKKVQAPSRDRGFQPMWVIHPNF